MCALGKSQDFDSGKRRLYSYKRLVFEAIQKLCFSLVYITYLEKGIICLEFSMACSEGGLGMHGK